MVSSRKEPNNKPGSKTDDAFAALDRRIAEQRAKHAAVRTPPPTAVSGLGAAMRLATEFVVSVGVGGLLGYGADALTSAPPWGLLIGLGFGFAAGVRSVMRVAGTPQMHSGAGAARDVSDAKDE
ncbi:MAG: AtpZ/AtpI family protein [Maricaulaceae bacterium]